MSRRAVLAGLPAATVTARRAAAAEPYPGAVFHDYARCMPDFLRGLATAAHRTREAALAKVTTLAAVKARQRWARETFWRLIGGEPERTPLATRTAGTFERSGYRVEKLIYESRPRFFVSANLYLPKAGKPPYPGVLFQMGHASEGKASGAYQKCCQSLAQLGFVVLAFDPMGQGERAFYLGNGGNRSRFSSPDAEHTVAGKQMLLVGDSATRMQVWDAIRSLDVLASHPLVDSKRLASTGQSGGGTSTMFLCAADERLAAAVVCGGNTENFALADFNPPGSTDDGEQNFPGAGPLGWDRWDLLHPFAGKPLLITVSDKDYFGTYSPRYIDNGWAEFAKLKKMYGVLGASERLAWGGTALPHGLGYDTRLQVYSWLSRWLRGDTRPVTEEPPGEPEPEATLFATASGSVVRSLGSETPFSLTRARTIARTPLDLAALLAIDRPPAINTALVLRSMPIGTAEVSAVEIPSAPGVSLPAWRYRPPRGTAVRGCIVLLQNAGRLTNWHQGGLFHELALAGHVVLVPDVRGSGDLTGELPRGSARHARDHDSEDAWAWASLVLGKPLLGQRVTDVLATLAAARHEHRRVWLCAQGKMTVPAQIAAALDPRVAGVYLAGGLVSFRSVVDTEAYQHAFANFVPGILVHTDLPEITRGIAPRPVVLAGAVDGAGNTMKPEVVRTLYGDAEHIQILPDAKWDAARIGEVAKPTA